jgi:hypothetical protein
MQFGSFSFPFNTPNNCLSGKFDDRNSSSAPSKKGSSMAAEVEDVVIRSAPARADHFLKQQLQMLFRGRRGRSDHLQCICRKSPHRARLKLSRVRLLCRACLLLACRSCVRMARLHVRVFMAQHAWACIQRKRCCFAAHAGVCLVRYCFTLLGKRL